MEKIQTMKSGDNNLTLKKTKLLNLLTVNYFDQNIKSTQSEKRVKLPSDITYSLTKLVFFS